MPRAIGANCRLLMIPEATYGTAPAGDWLRMPFLSCDLGAEQPLLDADVIGVGSSRDPAAPSWVAAELLSALRAGMAAGVASGREPQERPVGESLK